MLPCVHFTLLLPCRVRVPNAPWLTGLCCVRSSGRDTDGSGFRRHQYGGLRPGWHGGATRRVRPRHTGQVSGFPCRAFGTVTHDCRRPASYHNSYFRRFDVSVAELRRGLPNTTGHSQLRPTPHQGVFKRRVRCVTMRLDLLFSIFTDALFWMLETRLLITLFSLSVIVRYIIRHRIHTLYHIIEIASRRIVAECDATHEKKNASVWGSPRGKA